jgi:hypothetical protein
VYVASSKRGRSGPDRARVEIHGRINILTPLECLGEVDDVRLVAGLAAADNVGVKRHSDALGCR